MSKKKRESDSRPIEIGVILVLLALDLASKWWYWQQNKVVWNEGGLFGFLSGFFFEGLVGLILLWIVWVWWQSKRSMYRWGLALILAGGVGNIIDRVWFGAVRDFIYYPGFGLYGNVADIYLTMGVLLLIVYEIVLKPDTIPA